MTTGGDVFLETVSLNDEEPSSRLDKLESQTHSNGRTSIPEVEEEDNVDVVVIVEEHKPVEKSRPIPPSLPPLRVAQVNKEFEEIGDYVDPTLFSPEISRQSMDQAHRRARSLENELKELAALEPVVASSSTVKITPVEAVSIISGAFLSSITRVKQLVSRSDTEYDLLAGSSPVTKIEDLDTDGDGLQLSPEATRGDGTHFHTPRAKPALKRISAFASIDKQKKQVSVQRTVAWHDDVLDQDEEFILDEEDDFESEALMVNGNGAIANRQGTPRHKKKRKIVRGIMRRLTPREKEELYKLRPDLMIVPNWAQKYREEMSESDSTRWSFWLVSIIGTLLVLLLVLILLIAEDKAKVATKGH